MPVIRFRLVTWLLALAMLAGCELREPASQSPATSYLTAIPDPKTLGELYVSDSHSLLQPGTADVLNARLDSLDHSGRAHIDVVLVPSIGEAVPKTAATALFNKWKIGDPAKNNGLLMLLVMDQRRIEFETGYGLEGDLPDAICFRIQQEYMVPEMKAGRTDAAVLAGVAALIRRLKGAAPAAAPVSEAVADSLRRQNDQLVADLQAMGGNANTEPSPPALRDDSARDYATEPTKPAAWFGSRWSWPLGLVAGLALVAGLVLLTSKGEQKPRRLRKLANIGFFLLLISFLFQSTLVLLYLVPLLSAHLYFLLQYAQTRRPAWQALSRREQYLALTKNHKNLDFTAWLFPLGLTWYWPWHRRRLALLRDAPYTCPTCGQPMRRLGPTAEKPHLNAGQRAEEKVKSVDYDVWQCPAGHLLEQAYPTLHTAMRECPTCHYHTLSTGYRKAQAATTSAAGWGWKTTKCQACKYEKKEKYTIARIVASSSRSSSGGSSSSSSSSSRSSSSGGSSGGGGAGSSW